MKKLLCLIFVMFLSLPVFAEYKPIPKELRKQYKAEIEQIIDEEYPKIIKSIENYSLDAKKEYENIIKNDYYLYFDYISLAKILNEKIISGETDLYNNILKITNEKYLGINFKPFTKIDFLVYDNSCRNYLRDNGVKTKELLKLKKYRQKKREIIKNYLKEIREKGSIEDVERDLFFKNYKFSSSELSQQYKAEMEQIIDTEFLETIKNIDEVFSDTVEYYNDIKNYGNLKDWYIMFECYKKDKFPNSDKNIYQNLVNTTLNKYMKIDYKPYFQDTQYIFNAYLKHLFINNGIDYQKLFLITKYKNEKLKNLKKYSAELDKIYIKNILNKPTRDINYKPIPKELSEQYKEEMEQTIKAEYPKIIENIDILVLRARLLNERMDIYGYEDISPSIYNLETSNSLALLDLLQKLTKITQEKYLKVPYEPFSFDEEELYLNFLSPYFLDNNVNTKKIMQLEFYKLQKKDIFEQYNEKSGHFFYDDYEKRNFYFRKYRPVPRELSKQYKEEIEQIINEEYPKIIFDIDDDIKLGKQLYKRLIKNGYNIDDYADLVGIYERVIPAADLELYDKLAKVTNEKYLGVKHIPYGTDWVGLYEEYLDPYFKDNGINKKFLIKIVKYEVRKMIIIKRYIKIIEKKYPNRY